MKIIMYTKTISYSADEYLCKLSSHSLHRVARSIPFYCHAVYYWKTFSFGYTVRASFNVIDNKVLRGNRLDLTDIDAYNSKLDVYIVGMAQCGKNYKIKRFPLKGCMMSISSCSH